MGALRRRLARAAGVLGVLAILALIVAWWNERALAFGMLVVPPYAAGTTLEVPADVRGHLAITRGAATVRAWRFEPASEPRGTVLLLHGIRASKQRLAGRARQHAQHGLRAIAVDSRGHGESAGPFLTYGVEESRDLVALIDELDRNALLVQPLFVVGSSYGAATALQYAALDPRVARVVAISPFASLREVVPAYIRWMLGWPAQLVPPQHVNDLIDGAAQQAGFNADDACPRCVAPRIHAPVLLVHSRDDERIPWQHSAKIRDALTAKKELLLVNGARHVQTGGAQGVQDAIERWLGAD